MYGVKFSLWLTDAVGLQAASICLAGWGCLTRQQTRQATQAGRPASAAAGFDGDRRRSVYTVTTLYWPRLYKYWRTQSYVMDRSMVFSFKCRRVLKK